LDEYAFDLVNKTECMLYVPASSVDAYKAAEGWKDFLNIQSLLDSGQLTETITWELDSEGTLTISGTGAMPDYNFRYESAPWSAYGTEAIKSIVISDGVTSIGNKVFLYCSVLTSVTIPNSVTSIGDRAFEMCLSLISIDIPNSVSSIGDRAFSICEALTSIDIPEGAISIGNEAFSSCKSLTSISIPSSVTSMGATVFARCSTLNSIDVSAENNHYKSEAGVLFNKSMTTLITYPEGKQGEYIIPNSVASIDIFAFYVCTGLTSITIPNSVVSIGDNAFQACTGLTSITIPNSVTTIGDYVFASCSGLASITIPNSVTSIGVNAFDSCSGLTSITCYIREPLDISSVRVFGNLNTADCNLYVPASSVDAYKAAEVWKDFGNIFAISSVVIEEPKPAGNDGKGSIDFSLEIPGDASITGSFNIQLPEGYTLDETTTFLSEALAELFNLIITAVGDNTWRIEIVSNSLRASHNLPEYTKIMTIGYIVDESVENGNYQIELTDIDMQLEDGTSIQQESILVTTEVQRTETGIFPTAANNIKVYSTSEGIVVENAPVGEMIHIYNVSGALVAIVETQYFASVQTTIAIPQGIYIVKVGNTTSKVIVP